LCQIIYLVLPGVTRFRSTWWLEIYCDWALLRVSYLKKIFGQPKILDEGGNCSHTAPFYLDAAVCCIKIHWLVDWLRACDCDVWIEKPNSSSSSTNTSTSSGLPPPPPPPSHTDLTVPDGEFTMVGLHSSLLTPAESSISSSGQGRGSSGGATASVFLEEEEWDNVPAVPRLADSLCRRSLAPVCSIPPPILPLVSHLVFILCSLLSVDTVIASHGLVVQR